MTPRWLVLTIVGLALGGCSTLRNTCASSPQGWRAYAADDLLRLYDDFGASLSCGTLKRNGDCWTSGCVLPNGTHRSVVDCNGDGHPEMVTDVPRSGMEVFAYDSDGDGRIEALGQHSPDYSASEEFTDWNRDGIFDMFQVDADVGCGQMRLRVYRDGDEDGRFELIGETLRPGPRPPAGPCLAGPRPMNSSARPQ